MAIFLVNLAEKTIVHRSRQCVRRRGPAMNNYFIMSVKAQVMLASYMVNFHILLQCSSVSVIALCHFWKTVSAIDLYLSDTSWKHGANDRSTNCSLLPKMTSVRDSSKKWVATSYLANSIAVIVPTGVPLLSQYKRCALNKVNLFP